MTLPEESIHAQVLKHSLDAVFLTRPDGTIIYANPADRELAAPFDKEVKAHSGQAGIITGKQ